MINSFKTYLVEESREIFFTFGRMNPPTIGHGKLLDKLNSVSGRNPYKVFLSQSHDPKKNPLTYSQKVKHVRKMFPSHARNIMMNNNIKTVFDAAVNLYDQGYRRITMVVGSDRVQEFKTLLEKYNGEKGRHGFYNFEKIGVVSAGERDPDAEGVEGMSASKQRANAQNNDFTTFSQGVPKSMSNKDAKKLFNDIRVGMGLSEQTTFRQHIELETVSEEREKFIQGKLFEPGDKVIVKESNQTGRIYRLGTNYVIVSLDEGRITRQWIDGIEKIDEGFGDTSIFKDLFPGISAFLDKVGNKKRYEYAVRTFLDLRKKNPKHARQNLVKAAQIADVDVRTLDKLFRSMVDKGVMPKHLVNYHPTFKEEYDPSKHEWGTDASRKFATKMTPGQGLDEEVTQGQIRDLEKFADRLLNKFDIDIEFTKHFADRVNDARNKPSITIGELQRFFKKVADNKGKRIKKHGNAEAVLKDMQSDLNLPVVVNWKNGEFEVVNKTIMRKKGFKTSNPVVQYEANDEVSLVRKQIDREMEVDKARHDRMLDRARLIRARRKNAETRPNEGTAQDPDIKDREGTQPKRYHTGLSKSTKAKRDAHFKKHGKKADDDPSAYKPAPGDKDAKTKPSKYTKTVRKLLDAKNPKFNPQDMVTHNPVAKHAPKFNKSAVHTDKKKASKSGYQKHKGQDDV